MKPTRLIALCMAAWMTFQPLIPWADDIDLFVGSSAGAAANPNVLFVFDNTSNWSRNNQHFVGISSVGQMEASVAASVVSGLTNTAINIGVMEYVTGSGQINAGGFVRSAIRPMNVGSNQANLVSLLNGMATSVNNPEEKLNANTPYGGLMFDVYNYLQGKSAYATPGAIPSSATAYADNTAYSDGGGHTHFASPLSCGTSCAKTYVIFISNPDSNGPTADNGTKDATNTADLNTAGGNTTQLGLPNLLATTSLSSLALGSTTSCVPNATATSTCPTDPTKYYTTAGIAAGVTQTSSNTQVSSCNASVGTYASALSASCADSASYPFGCAYGAVQSGTANCASGTQRYGVDGVTNGQPTTLSKTISGSAMGTVTGSNADWTFTTTAAAPTYVSGMQVNITGCAAGSSGHPALNGTYTVTASSGSAFHVSASKDSVTCTSGTAAFSGAYIDASQTWLGGYTASCAASLPSPCDTSAFAAQCSGYSGGCVCESTHTTATGTTCGSGTSLYTVNGLYPTSSMTPTGSYTTDAHPWNADEWSRFLYQNGISFGSSCSNQQVKTYAIDVTNNPPNAGYTPLLMNMARVSGGQYFMASSTSGLQTALNQILGSIMATNSTFASAALPVSATNRSQDENQVYIGMFRPDPDAKPRWFGNLKRYQFGFAADGTVQLSGTNTATSAVNNNTGFIDDCATSFWTSDSPLGTTPQSYYWSQYATSPTPTSNCVSVTGAAKFSDAPDGPIVEKGSVAEVLRSGNMAATTPDWMVHRNFYTTDASGNMISGAPTTGLTSDQQAWLQGKDNYLNDASGYLAQESQSTSSTANLTRASIHGDVIHSRPLPVNYGTPGLAGLVVYYGANDGNYRAVDSASGQELWTLIPNEFATSSFVERLRQNTLLVSHPTANSLTLTAGAPKQYGWDGSTGLYQKADNSKVYIYPTQHRGGHYVYGIDVTHPQSPSSLFRIGCDPSGASCTTGFTGMGQSWSTPNIAPVLGQTNPVAFFGGGYDTCEDANNTTSCATTSGNHVYAVDATTGTRLDTFPPTDRAVPADISLVDVNGDGKADYGYAVDTGGNLYRLTMVTRNADGTVSSLAPGNWTLRKIAHTTGAGRKFLFAPTLFYVGSTVYVAMGSGDREHPLATQYPYTTPIQNRFYVYIDDLTSATNNDNLDDPYVNMSTDIGCSGTPNATVLSKGWYMDLTQCGTGEQTVTSALIAGGAIAFSTNCPVPAAAGTCATDLGKALGYWVNLQTASGTIGSSSNCGGGRASPFAGGGLPPSPVMNTVMITGANGPTPVTVILGASDKDGGPSTIVTPQHLKPSIPAMRKRVYWKQDGVD